MCSHRVVSASLESESFGVVIQPENYSVQCQNSLLSVHKEMGKYLFRAIVAPILLAAYYLSLVECTATPKGRLVGPAKQPSSCPL